MTGGHARGAADAAGVADGRDLVADLHRCRSRRAGSSGGRRRRSSWSTATSFCGVGADDRGPVALAGGDDGDDDLAVAPSTTWLLVRISPSEVSTMPVPAPTPAAHAALDVDDADVDLGRDLVPARELSAASRIRSTSPSCRRSPRLGTVAVEPGRCRLDPDGAGVVGDGRGGGRVGRGGEDRRGRPRRRRWRRRAGRPRGRRASPIREPDEVQPLRRGAGPRRAAPYGVDGGTGGGAHRRTRLAGPATPGGVAGGRLPHRGVGAAASACGGAGGAGAPAAREERRRALRRGRPLAAGWATPRRGTPGGCCPGRTGTAWKRILCT